jgi:hypothetical protein
VRAGRKGGKRRRREWARSRFDRFERLDRQAEPPAMMGELLEQLEVAAPTFRRVRDIAAHQARTGRVLRRDSARGCAPSPRLGDSADSRASVELSRSCGVVHARPVWIGRENVQMLGTILLIILILLLIGALPTWPYSRGWGYYPTGGLGLILIIILILLLMGRI